MERNKKHILRDNIVNVIVILGIIIIMFIVGFNIGKMYHMEKNIESFYRYYYGTIEAIIRNTGIIQIKANGTIYEIGYTDELANGSETVLVEIDDKGNLINVWNLAYNIEEEID